MEEITLETVNKMRSKIHYDKLTNMNDLSEIELLINSAALEYYNKDYKLTFEYFTKLVYLGVSEAYVDVGNCYCYGHHVNQDYKLAFEYFKKAEALGVSRALVNIGNCYHYGKHVDQDYKLAFEYYKKAEALGVSRALVYIGHCYYDGLYVNQDHKLSFEYYKKAEVLGVSSALVDVGDHYYHGYYVDKDYKLAFEYYKKNGLTNQQIKKTLIKIPDSVYSDYEIQNIKSQLKIQQSQIKSQQEEIALLKIDMQYAPYRPHYSETKVKYEELCSNEYDNDHKDNGSLG